MEKKLLKTVNETENSTLQEISEADLAKVENTLERFFSGIKTLLREGAVLVIEEETPQSDGEPAKTEESLRENFLSNEEAYREPLTIQRLAALALGGQLGQEFARSIKETAMDEDYNVTLKTAGFAPQGVAKMGEIISSRIKNYTKELPQIMHERGLKLQLLCNLRPDVKKYLENKTKRG